MEALELLKTWKRICVETEDCDNCPVPCSCSWSEEEDDTLEEMIQGIEKWEAEHPEGTERDKPEDPEIEAINRALGSVAHLFNGEEGKVSSI